MAINEQILTKLEKKWILQRRIRRLTDNKEVQIYPMGAERYLSSVLFNNKQTSINLKAEIKEKNILIIPGYGTSAFLFALSGAKSITVYDKDPVTIAWVKAFKKYYHFREHSESINYPSVGELLSALTQWYPPLLELPMGKYTGLLFWALHPQSLRRRYIHYMVSLVRKAIEEKNKGDFELDKDILFYSGTIDKITENKGGNIFDTAFIPYLLGVQNGIVKEKEITLFLKQLLSLVPNGHILVNPSRNTKEFYITGTRYFVTTEYKNIQSIPELEPYFIEEDKKWFRTQGIAVFGNKNS